MSRTITVCMLAVAILVPSVSAQLRDVQLTITTADTTGAAIAGVPALVIADSRESSVAVKTDTSGRASLTLTIPSEQPDLCVMFAAEVAGEGESSADGIRQAIATARSVLEEYSFPACERVTLNGTDTEYTLSIVAHDAVTISGNLITASGAPCDGLVMLAGSTNAAAAWSDEEGAFSLGGATAGSATRLFALEGNLASVVQMNQSQTTVDADIGDVVVRRLEDLGGTAMLDLHLTNVDELDARVEQKDMTVILISEDGSIVCQLLIEPSGRVVREYFQETPSAVPLPAGKYLVVPGTLWGSNVAKVLDLLGSGQDADALGLITVEAVAGIATTVTVDAAAADQAVATAGGG